MELIRSYFNTLEPDEYESPLYITWAGQRICSPEHSIGPRVLDNYKMVLVVRGKGYFLHRDNEVPIGEGDMFWLFPGIKHYYYADHEDPWEILWISFNGKMCESFTNSIQISPQNPFMFGASTGEITACMKEIISGLEGNCRHKLRAMGNLYILFDLLLKKTSENDGMLNEHDSKDVISKAIKYIDVNYHHHVDVNMICSYVSYSRSYFSRLFKKEMGMSMPEYVNHVRIKRAKFLLKNTNLNINEIAKSVGYEDPFYFSRKFKDHTGESPAKYLETYLKKHPQSKEDVGSWTNQG